jgi:hypothetical protein
MEKKIIVLIVGAVVVLALVVVGATAFFNGNNNGKNSTTITPTPVISTNSTLTALQAFSIADNDANVKSWKSSNKNVSVAEVSSEFCTDGLSSSWVVTYASDSGEAAAHIESGKMTGLTTTKTTERLYPVHNTAMSTVIDSTKADEIAAGPRNNVGVRTMGPASASLIFKASGTPIWDWNFPVDGGNFIIRINAQSGNVTESATIWR